MINIVEFDDWIQIFVDDDLKYENHRIDPEELLGILKIDFTHKFIEGWDWDKEPYNKFSEYEDV